jgi:hypothetical protein
VTEAPTCEWEGHWSDWKNAEDCLDIHIYKQAGIYTVTPFHSKSHKEWAYLYLDAARIEKLPIMQDEQQIQAQKPEGAKPSKSLKGGGARRVTVQLSTEQKESQEEAAKKKKMEQLAEWVKSNLTLTSPEQQAVYDAANPCGDNDSPSPWHYFYGVKFKKPEFEAEHPEVNQIVGPERKQLHANHAEMFKRKSNAAQVQMELMKAETNSATMHMAGVGLAFRAFSELFVGPDNTPKGRAIRGLRKWAKAEMARSERLQKS